MKNWFFVTPKGEQKAVPEEELKSLLKQGFLTGSSQVWEEGTPSWVPVSSTRLCVGLQSIQIQRPKKTNFGRSSCLKILGYSVGGFLALVLGLIFLSFIVPGESPPAKMDEEIVLRDSIWVVTKAEILRNDNVTIIQVIYHVTNTTKDQIMVIQAPSLIDSQGRRFEELMPIDVRADSSLYNLIQGNESIYGKALRPSIPKTFQAVFETAKEAKGLNFMALTLQAYDGAYTELPISTGI